MARNGYRFGRASLSVRGFGFSNRARSRGLLLQAQRQLAQSETAATIALVAVYKALGGAWQ
jgi:hypothetical protein